MKLPKPEEFNERQQKLYELIKFFSRLFLVGIALRGILWIYPDTTGFQAFNADIIAGVMNLMGYDFSVNGIRILTPGIDYIISQDCTGWKSGMALIGLVYASTGRLRKHYRFVLLGLAAVFIANIIRVVTTIILAESGLVSFEIVHGFLWRWGLTAIVFAVWMVWFKGLEDGEKDGDTSTE